MNKRLANDKLSYLCTYITSSQIGENFALSRKRTRLIFGAKQMTTNNTLNIEIDGFALLEQHTAVLCVFEAHCLPNKCWYMYIYIYGIHVADIEMHRGWNYRRNLRWNFWIGDIFHFICKPQQKSLVVSCSWYHLYNMWLSSILIIYVRIVVDRMCNSVVSSSLVQTTCFMITVQRWGVVHCHNDGVL